MLLLRFVGEFLLRFAERAFLGLLFRKRSKNHVVDGGVGGGLKLSGSSC